MSKRVCDKWVGVCNSENDNIFFIVMWQLIPFLSKRIICCFSPPSVWRDSVVTAWTHSHISLFSVLRRGNVSQHSEPIMQIYQVCHVRVKNSCLYGCRDKRLLCSVLFRTAPKDRASRWLVNWCRCVNGLTFCTSRLQKAPRLWHDAEF